MEISFTRVALLAAALFFVGCDQNHNPPKPTLLKLPFLKAKPWVPSGVPASRIDAKRSAELKEKIQTQLDADDQLLSTYKRFRADAL